MLFVIAFLSGLRSRFRNFFVRLFSTFLKMFNFFLFCPLDMMVTSEPDWPCVMAYDVMTYNVMAYDVLA